MGKSVADLESPTTAGMADLRPADAVMGRSHLRFVGFTIGVLFVTHALAFFLHEYAHATVAWMLGYKANPLNINYGHLDISNVLLQQEIDENVNYRPIFDANAGYAAAAIALAGVVVGSVVLYVVCALILRTKLERMRPAVALFLFWLALMASANLWSYAPVRTITTHGDMAVAARGLGVSSWALFPFVVLLSIGIAWDFFARLMPLVLGRTCGGNVVHRVFAMVIACFIFFGFYGGCPAIGGNYGDVSALFSIASMFVLLPIAVMMALTSIPLERTVPAE